MSIIKLPCGQKVMIDESNFLNVEDKFRNEDTSSKSITVDRLSVSDRINFNSLSGMLPTTVPEEEQLSYPVIIRLNEFDTSVKMIERNIKAGLKAVKAMFERDVNAISLAHSISVRDSNEPTGVRVITLQHSSVYRLGDNTRLNGHGEIVILPRNEVPEVRAALMTSILVDSEYTAKLVEQHDKLYGMMK